jgi:uncharacterized DUF497 family protein
MRIESVIWLVDVADKLVSKHHVEAYEVEEVLSNRPRFRFVEKGKRQGEDIYLALGQTDAGRYLAVVFIYKTTKEALVERQGYGNEGETTVWQKMRQRACLNLVLSTR